MLAQHKLMAVVGGVFAASLVCEALLGWVLGVTDAWLPIFVVAALLAVLISADARLGRPGDPSEGSYDKVVCAVVVVAVVGAVACLYLPLPWGGLAAGAVVVGLVLALRVSQDRPRG